MSLMGVAFLTPLPLYLLLLGKKIYACVKQKGSNYEHVDDEKPGEIDKDILMRVWMEKNENKAWRFYFFYNDNYIN